MPHAGLFCFSIDLLSFVGGSMVASYNICMHTEERLGTRLEKSVRML